MSLLFSKWYDFFMSPLEKNKFKRIRKELLSKATGQVLEIGSGTGINFPLYRGVDKVVATEPSPHMIERSRQKHQQFFVPIMMVQANAEDLPFAENSFDTVVATLVFCTIPNPEKAMEEIIRVCKPGGKILFFEHIKMDNDFLAALQEVLTPGWKKICDGCCLNRDTLGLLKENNLQINEMKNYYNGLFIFVEALNNKN